MTWIPALVVSVLGIPKPQPRVRAYVRNGHAAVYDPGTAGGWKLSIWLAIRDRIPARPIEGPIKLDIFFLLPRPKRLKDGGPHISRPDIDNLEKAVMDSLTQCGVWRDDSQVCDKHSSKSYVGPDETPGAEIMVWTPNREHCEIEPKAASVIEATREPRG